MKINHRWLVGLALGTGLFLSMACSMGGLLQRGQKAAATAAPILATVQSTPAAQSTPADQPTQAAQATVADTATPAAAAPGAQATLPPPNLPSDQILQKVKEAWERQASAGPRHVSQNSFKGETLVSNMEVDSAPPNYHAITSLKGTVIAEQYVYAGDLYTKVRSTWIKVPGGGAAFVTSIEDISKEIKDLLVLSDGKVLGVEFMNNSSAWVYSYASTLKDSGKEPTQNKIWVDVVSGLPVKRESVTTSGTKIVQVITYDKTISISLPDEAKNAPTK